MSKLARDHRNSDVIKIQIAKKEMNLPAGVTEATFMLGNSVVPWVARDYINALRKTA